MALAATPSRDGILDLVGPSGANAFVVATVNLGAADTIAATAGANATLPISISICQTNPSSGQCLGPAAASVSTMIAAGATPTFAIFVGGAGTVPFDPVANRISVQFTGSDGNVPRLDQRCGADPVIRSRGFGAVARPAQRELWTGPRSPRRADDWLSAATERISPQV